jgi:hypothetical protein
MIGHGLVHRDSLQLGGKVNILFFSWVKGSGCGCAWNTGSDSLFSVPPCDGCRGKSSLAPESEELEVLKLELDVSDPLGGGSPWSPSAPFPLPSGIGVVPFLIRIDPSSLMVHGSRNPSSSSLSCQPPVNSRNYLWKSFVCLSFCSLSFALIE